MKISFYKFLVGSWVFQPCSCSPARGLFAAPEVPVKGMVRWSIWVQKNHPLQDDSADPGKTGKGVCRKGGCGFPRCLGDAAPARHFGIGTIPPQSFFDKKGKEVYRHEGFLGEEEIVRRLKDMGVK
ncbi:MAG: hypothetical protein L7F78_07850 [Syntrophales bacterium LBB04]|nr:hypothetical protein [Syntrophales bacterium LBB04]